MTPQKHIKTIDTAVVANADDAYYVSAPSGGGKWVPKVLFLPWANVTSNATELRKFTLKKGSTVISDVISTADGAWTAGTEFEITKLSTAGLNAEFTGGTDVLTILDEHGGATGRASDGQLTIEWSRCNN